MMNSGALKKSFLLLLLLFLFILVWFSWKTRGSVYA
jgi:hypothetical protein